jgi:hypothetical protein
MLYVLNNELALSLNIRFIVKLKQTDTLLLGEVSGKEFFKELSKRELSGCFETWKASMQQCFASDRNYFKANKI